MSTANILVLGASGYTGAETVRLLARHPNMRIAALTADRKAGQEMASVFPHLGVLDLPTLQRVEDLDLSAYDGVVCCLPHGTTQETVAAIPAGVKVADLSADFRLSLDDYKKWYGADHKAPERQKDAVYGLTEHYRDAVKAANLVAVPGCYPTSALNPLIPLIKAGAIDLDDIVVDAKSGVTGAGRAPAEGKLHTEVSEGFHAYGVGHHRHMSELDQELGKAAGRDVMAAFTPHLLPMNRGILSTIYVKGEAQAIHQVLAERYRDEYFVGVLPFGEVPATRHVRGSNHQLIGVVADRRPGRTIIVSVLDNLVKGAAGQGLQNLNLMLGLDETAGLQQAPLFP
ncbi:MAG: N-acetyl-gamma-glutamyl-phosphate reductase [Alphaproteobacteria bacterium]